MLTQGFEPQPRRRGSLTIRGRLALSFSTILALFALNLTVYYWSNARRRATVEELRQAISCQIIIADIQQKMKDTQKQIALLSQAVVETAGAMPGEVMNFRLELNGVRQHVSELRRLSNQESAKRAEEFGKDYDLLSASWLTFYENFGVNNAKAITELAMRGDPLSQRVLQQTVPDLLDSEKRRVETASSRFYEVASLADRITGVIFVTSGIVAIIVALMLSRYLTHRLCQLKLGAALIGSGRLDHRIGLGSTDELGDLAVAFDAMTDQLSATHSQLTLANRELEIRHDEVAKQREVAESLLLNILPSQIADELRAKDSVDPKYFEDVTILFTDFVGFSASTLKLSAEDLVHLLHDYFTTFDQITTRYGIEKLKTIGDSYMCVGGMPARTPSHPVDTVMAAFEMIEAVRQRALGRDSWRVRVGIHTGPVIAGVVGIKKFAFDIWGESVNLGSRMESGGAENRINISERTYSRVKDFFECEYRGRVMTKDKLEQDMYFVNRILPDLVKGSGHIPPPAFLRRYQIYFQKQPPAFPDCAVFPHPNVSNREPPQNLSRIG